MKIAHLADLHVRGLSRHAEVREIFEAFLERAKSLEVDHIFIAGDLFHTKTTGLSPEYIDLMSWLFSSLIKVAPLHIMLGNHDGNLVNLSRQDAITPIVNALQNDRMHVYKNSGVYSFAPGFNWCVFSPFDKLTWKSIAPVPGDVNIACYHGPVKGAYTDDTWTINDGVEVEFFSKYDFAMLGDIHRQQYLAHRVVSNGKEKPRVAYCGSVMQQNYAEKTEHGFLLWDISSRDDFDVTFVALPNPKPYVTVDWTDLQTTVNLCKSYPKNSRFRIRANYNFAQKDVQAITTILGRDMSATEVTFKIDRKNENFDLMSGATSLVRADLHNVDVILKLMHDFYDGNSVSDEEWELIKKHVQRYVSSVDDNDVVRNTQWTLRRMTFDNMFSYGSNNIINFDELSGVVGIFGTNRIGKSSIVGTIMYLLYNTTDRGPMKNLHIINARKSHCTGQAIIAVGGVNYVIERQTVKYENKRGVGATTSLNLFKTAENNSLVDLCGEQRPDTEKVIRRLIGTSDDFLLTSLSAQGDMNQFIAHGSAKRKQILSKFLDLDVFDQMHEQSNKDANSMIAVLRNFPNRDWDEQITNARDKLSKLERDITSKTSQLLLSQERLAQAQREYLVQRGTTPVTSQQVDEQQFIVKTLEAQDGALTFKLEEHKADLTTIANKISHISASLSKYDIEDLHRQHAALVSLKASVSTLRADSQKEVATLAQYEKSSRTLDEVPCGNQYPTCKFIKDAHLHRVELSAQRSRAEKALARVNEAQSSLSVIEGFGIVEKIAEFETLSAQLNKLNLSESHLRLLIVQVETDVKSVNNSLMLARQKVRELTEAIGNVGENTDSLLVEINSLQKKVKKLDDEKLVLANQIGRISSDIEKLERDKLLREEQLRKLRISELITDAFSKKGIPSSIVQSQLPLINAEIARILHGIVDFTIELEAGENESMEVYINYGDSKRIIELGSGMEKVVSSIAIRVALINVSSLPKTDMFIIDESFGALDDESVEACNRLLCSLKKYFRIVLVITHVEGIKDSADQIIEIMKDEKDSRVIYDNSKM